MKESTRKLLPALVDISSAGGVAIATAAAANPQDAAQLTIALAIAQPFVVRVAEALCDRRATEEFHRERDKEWFDDVEQNLVILREMATSAQQDAERTINNSITIEEAMILLEQYRDHAARSAVDERRKLLAAAAASTFRPDVDTEMKCRAERALAILEPSDIEALRMLRTIIAEEHSGSEVRILFNEYPLVNRMTLEQAGCVFTHRTVEVAEDQRSRWGASLPSPKLRQTPDITPLGKSVLTLLETYKPDSAKGAPKASNES